MNLTQIEYFLEATKTLNFTLAAKNLFVSQPALSKQIALLEEELSIKLFIRKNHKVELTKAGLQLKMDLNEVVNSIEKAKNNAIRIGKEEETKINVACFDGVYVDDFLPSFIEEIGKNFPERKLNIIRKGFLESEKKLLNEEVDLMFTLENTIANRDKVCIKKIIKRKSGIAYSKKLEGLKNGKIEKENLKNFQFIIVDDEPSRRLLENEAEVLNKMGINIDNILLVDNFMTLITYIEMGKGIAILGEGVPRKNQDLYVDDFGENMNQYVVAVWKRDRKDIEIVMNCVDFVTE